MTVNDKDILEFRLVGRIAEFSYLTVLNLEFLDKVSIQLRLCLIAELSYLLVECF